MHALDRTGEAFCRVDRWSILQGGQVKQTRLDDGCKEEDGNWNEHCTGWMKQLLYRVDETVIVQGGWNSYCTGWMKQLLYRVDETVTVQGGWNSYCTGWMKQLLYRVGWPWKKNLLLHQGNCAPGWMKQSLFRMDETVIVQVDETVMKQGGWNKHCT